MRAGERTELGGELDAGSPSVGQRARTGRGACERAGDRGERVGVAGHRGRSRDGAHGLTGKGTDDRKGGGDRRLGLLVE